MWKTLHSKYHLQVPQENVRLLLKQIDPIGVQNRRRHRLARRTYRSRGPNDCWHIDGYDKLKPYGFFISGCIDGYSRRIMWLKCAYTNHDPAVISRYFLDCTQHVGGFPDKCRTDCGTENTIIADIQALVNRRSNAHLYGTSPANQRIEGWWSFYRKFRSQWWIELFEDLIQHGALSLGNAVHIECLRFCFMNLIRNDLQYVESFWNTHRIRPSVGARCPAGIPDELYFLPLNGSIDCKHVCRLDHSWWQLTKSVGIRLCANETFEEWLRVLCQTQNWLPSSTVEEATHLYLKLLTLPVVQQCNLNV